MKKAWILAAAIAVIGLLYFRMKSQAPELTSPGPSDAILTAPAAPPGETPPAAPPTPAPNLTPAAAASNAESSLDVLKKRLPIEKQIPKLQDVRNEIAKDPHGTPKALLQFSADLANKMTVALQSKEASQYMMKELDTCASGKSVETASSASAVCIKSAYELSAKYPDLMVDSDRVRDHADPEALKIYKGMKRLGL